jgi:hypothetical protein
MFGIISDGKVIGRIVVGSAEYNYAVFEAGSTPLPPMPSPPDVATSLERDIGLRVDLTLIGMPRLTYLGYASYFALYEVAGNSVAFDIRSGRACRVDDLRNFITPVAEYQAIRGGITPSIFAFNSLPVPIRDMRGLGYENNCGPAAGAEIDEYYKQYRGYSRFDDWYVDHNALYVTMKTNQFFWFNGTVPWEWGPGFVSYAAQKSYSFGTFWIQSPMYTDFDAIRNFIDINCPPAVLFWGEPLKPSPCPTIYTWHYVAVRGYWVDDYGEYLIVNDGWGGVDFVNWDINWGATSLHFVYPG